MSYLLNTEVARRRRAWLAGASLCLLAAAASPSVAQTASTDQEVNALEDIIVTARKRSESLQEVPASVSASTGESLERAGVVTLDQLAVPGLTFATSGGSRPYLAIRGSGNRSGGTDAPVGVFMDGVYISRNSQLSHGPVDVDRVEVIKGPQGTIYGRNTIAGAINLITADPTENLEGHVQAGAGFSTVNDDRLWNAEAVISGPIVPDVLLGRLVVAHEDRRGFQLDDTNGNRANGVDATTLRGKLLWTPNETFTAKLTLDYTDDSRPRGAFLLFYPGRNHVLNPTIPVSQLDFGDNVWDIRSEFQTYEDFTSTRAILDLSQETALGTLTSVTSIGKSESAFSYNNDETQYDISRTFSNEQSDNISQEFRLSGQSGDFDYLFGIYYFQERTDENELNLRGVDSLTPGRRQFIESGLDLNAYAAFSQISYQLTPALSVTGGLRYSLDEKAAPIRRTLNNVLQANLTREESWDSWDGTLSARYEFSDVAMAYASINTGFKSGGFVDPRNLIDVTIAYAPEHVIAYETGFKADFLDDTLRINTAVFYNMYRDLQVTSARQDPLQVGQTIFVTQNAAEANIPGLEIEAQYIVDDNFSLRAAYSYLDAKIGNFDYVPGPTSVDINGAIISRSPKHTLVGGLYYDRQIGGGDLHLGFVVDYKDKFVNELETRLDPTGNVANVEVTARTIANIEASFEWDNWTVSAFGRNVFNEEYITVGLQGSPSTFPFATPGEPRTFGMQLRRSF